MTDFPALLKVANIAWVDPSETNIEALLQFVNNSPEPETILENAMIEVLCDLTMDEYLCQTKQHEQK